MPVSETTKAPLPTAEPSLVTLPDLTVAAVRTSEEPGEVGAEVMKALYGAAYSLKFALKKHGVEMKLGWPRARWEWAPGSDTKSPLAGDWALPVPEGTRTEDLVQKSERFGVAVERWDYGDCAWIMHAGSYDAEEPTIARLVAFIEESGLEVAGVHEEWYLSQPSAKVPKTVILYPVRPKTA
jgi:hypothetical protein